MYCKCQSLLLYAIQELGFSFSCLNLLCLSGRYD